MAFPLFSPTLDITLYAVVILVVINFFYKILINQNEARRLKQKTKETRELMKKYQKEGNTEKTKEIMSEMMSDQNRLMKMTMKPMIVSFIIVILILPTINNIYGDIRVDDKNGNIMINGAEYEMRISGNMLDVAGPESSFECELPCEQSIQNSLWEIRKEGSKIVFARINTQLPVTLPLIGSKLGWLGWYIMLSLPLALIIRRLLKIHV